MGKEVNEITKRLQKLLKNKKAQKVVYKQGSVRNNNRNPGSEGCESYIFNNLNED